MAARSPRVSIAPMRPSPPPSRALRSAVALAAALTFGTLGTLCGDGTQEIWVCLNPATGRLDHTIYDENHFVNGQADPCHCYDPCGEAPTCPILVDAGPPPLGCDAGADGP
jgi:hypothetical protein